MAVLFATLDYVIDDGFFVGAPIKFHIISIICFSDNYT